MKNKKNAEQNRHERERRGREKITEGERQGEEENNVPQHKASPCHLYTSDDADE